MSSNYSRVTDQELKELYDKVYHDLNPRAQARQNKRDLITFILGLVAVQGIAVYFLLKRLGVL